MNHPNVMPRLTGALRTTALLLALPLAIGVSSAADERLEVGKAISPAGSLLERRSGTKKWTALKQNAPIYSGDLIVGASTDAFIDSKNGHVRLGLLADLAEISPHQGMESAVVLYDPPRNVDLDFVLDRGLVDLINRKDKGPANVRIHFQKETWDLVLSEPGTRVALELYGRWARGVPFQKVPDNPPEEPTAHLTILVVKGQAEVKHERHQYSMRAPPGPAILNWSNFTDDEPPQKLDKLPPRAEPEAYNTPGAKALGAAFERLRKRFAEMPVEAALAETMKSKDPLDRRVAMAGYAAIDDLPALLAAAQDAKLSDIREETIVVLRQWIGRGPGQDLKLYKALLKAKVPPAHAEIIMQLLHSFGDKELSRPETYELLIDYLLHPSIAVRTLAEFHLTRLVPAGKKIKYDPAGSEAELKKAHSEWKKLVPDGQLPKEEKIPPKKDKTPPKKG